MCNFLCLLLEISIQLFFFLFFIAEIFFSFNSKDISFHIAIIGCSDQSFFLLFSYSSSHWIVASTPLSSLTCPIHLSLMTHQIHIISLVLGLVHHHQFSFGGGGGICLSFSLIRGFVIIIIIIIEIFLLINCWFNLYLIKSFQHSGWFRQCCGLDSYYYGVILVFF